ncbi:LamG-like jellyroll fold domain-containing protein [Acrocarpospora catenulata]|uniref:LamG-like jellyroll fold domain-containing protein n=1 Tax=Acrocarpospora catenulata TaxID=2836182 RepID=UPI001BDA906E|nr:LamG-like jellyroll fold domain-containing protein [Acrocarpospora catenulata]
MIINTNGAHVKMSVKLRLLLVAGVIASLLTASPVSAEEVTATPVPDQPRAPVTQFPKPEDPDLALRQGIASAKEQNKPVEVAAVGTESSWTWAYPDGKLTTQTFPGQARVKQADGSFRWVDTTLVADGDRVRPKVAVAEVELGGGGSPFLASLERDGQLFALDWQDQLPQPRLDGNKAIYPDAAGPGADVVVTALAGGFRHDVILRRRPSGPVEYRFPVTTKGLDLVTVEGGGLKLTDRKGKTVASAATPYVQEATTTDPKTGIAHRGRIDLKLARGKGGAQELVVRPDPAFLADENTTYPVTVDPVVSLTATTDAWVEHVNNTANSTGEVFHVGTGTYWAQERRCQGTVCTYTNKIFPQFVRGYVKFQDSGEYLGKYIDSANIRLVGYYTGPCTDAVITASPITSAWSTTGLSWTNRPPTTGTGAVTTQPSCNSGIITNTIDVTAMAKAWAAGTPNHGVELKSNEDPRSTWPDDPNPRVTQYWSFDSVESGKSPAMLSVTYLLPPEIPTVTGESIDSIVGNDAISRTSDVKINYWSTSIDGKKLDYLVSIADPTTPIPVPTTAPSPSPSPTPSPSPSPTSTPIPGLVAAYGMNEGSGTTIADASGSGNTGTASGTTWAAGKYGQALTFNGTSNWVTVNDAASLRLTNKMTVEAWVKPSSTSGWRSVVAKEGTTDTNYALYSSVSSGPSGPVGPLTYVQVGSTADAAGATAALSTTSWSHIAGTYDGTTIKTYVNGVLAAQATTSGNLVTSTLPLRIGGNSIYGEYFKGLIDEVRIYNAVLTQGQIQSDMNTPVGSQPPADNPPSAPGTLTAVAGPDTVDLTWGAATDDRGAVTYQVHRSKTANFTPTPATRIATVNTLTYSNSGMPQGQYYYRIVAIDNAGQAGPSSNEVAAMTSAQLFPPISSALSGQVIRSEFNLGSPDSFKFKIKVCLTGVTPRICNETPFYRITTDAPHLPTDLATGTAEPLNPTLSGVVSRPSGGPVKGRFYLYKSDGTPLGPVPLAEGEVSGGARLIARVPDGLIVEDGSYYWRMDACLAEICTPKTAPLAFGAAVPEPNTPATQQLTLTGAALTIRSAPAAATACGGTTCPFITSPVQVGGSGAARKVSLIKASMSTLPPGATILSAVLDLGGATCAGSCPNSQVIAAHVKKSELEETPTGSALVADLVPQSQQQVQVGWPEIDVTANAIGWRHEIPDETFIDPGLVVLSSETVPSVELGGAGAARPTSLLVTFRPAGPPGIIPRIDVRQGDGGALLRWARPDDLGADTEITNFDLEVLDQNNTVLRSLTTEEATVIVGGLTNGAAYRFQVRTRTPYGVGPWKVSADIGPQAVPGGTAAYQNAVADYVEAKQSLLDGRTENTGEAIENADDASRIEPMLYARQHDLVTAGAEDRATGDIELTDTLVSKLSDSTIVVRSAIAGTTLYDQGEDTTENVWKDTEDFVFTTDVGGTGQFKLSGEHDASAVDGIVATSVSEINAWPGGVAPNPVDELPPVDESIPPDESARFALAVPPPDRRRAAATWAVTNVGPANRNGWEYVNDCANFVSKALARGGRFRQIHAYPWLSYLDKRSDDSWWEYKWKDDSFTFSAASNNFRHFYGNERIAISGRYNGTISDLSKVRPGDVVYFWNRKTNEFSHMGIVTKLKVNPPVTVTQIYFAQHGGDQGSGTGPYMNLGERFFMGIEEFSGLVFGRVNW